jgi:hypothetical protein
MLHMSQALKQTKDHDRVIGQVRAWNAQAAAIDAKERSNEALEDHRDFFENPAHQQKIQQVCSIVDGFFQDYRQIYVTHRGNRGRPFTSVKVECPLWPSVSSQAKQQAYLDPLHQLGVEIIWAKSTNSYLYRIT